MPNVTVCKLIFFYATVFYFSSMNNKVRVDCLGVTGSFKIMNICKELCFKTKIFMYVNLYRNGKKSIAPTDIHVFTIYLMK